LTGIIGGVKAFYIPFLIIPFFYGIVSKRNVASGTFFFLLGMAIWVLPLLFLMGSSALMANLTGIMNFHYEQVTIALKDYGIGNLFLGLVQSIWADGLGGYW